MPMPKNQQMKMTEIVNLMHGLLSLVKIQIEVKG
jgi:hypothetical protein